MMMMGIHFMGEVPFRDVYVHALVRDEEGKKMSKSTGNVIDPLTVIDAYGTDAFRFTLAAFAAQGRDIKMSEKRVEGYRHFINKLWNAARFSLMHLEGGAGPVPRDGLSLPDRWVLARLGAVREAVASALNGFRFNDAAGALYQFVWHELCDWYLEMVKPDLYGHKGEARRSASLAVLRRTLADTLVLLHPFIPFVTEEVWHHLPGTEGSIMNAPFPEADPANRLGVEEEAAEAAMDKVIGVIGAVRTIRGEMNVNPARTLSVRIQTADDDALQTLERHRERIVHMARLEELTLEAPGPRPRAAATAVVDAVTVFVLLEGVIDFDVEAARLEKEIGKLEKELAGLGKKLANEGFLSKAPDEVVAGVRGKRDGLAEKREKLAANLERIRQMA
jgi:valyl-tRNA synthetase